MFASARAQLDRLQVSGLLWLVARVWVGWQFLMAGWDKVFGLERAVWTGDQAGVAVGEFLGFSLMKAPGGQMAGAHPEVTGWYADLIRRVILPNAELFGYLVAFGELFVGLALICGVFTRFAAAMGLLMNLSYLLAGVSGLNPLMLLVELPILLGVTTAGYYGLDHFLAPRLRHGLDRLPRPLPHGSPAPARS